MGYLLMNKDTVAAAFMREPASTGAAAPWHLQKIGGLPLGFTDIGAWLAQRSAAAYNYHVKGLLQRLGCVGDEAFLRLTHAASVNDTFWVKAEGEGISWEQVSPYRNRFAEAVSRLAFEGEGAHEAGKFGEQGVLRALTEDGSEKALQTQGGLEADLAWLRDLVAGEALQTPQDVAGEALRRMTGSDAKRFAALPELSCEGSFRKCFCKEDVRGEFGSDIFVYKRGNEFGAGLEPYGEVLAAELAGIISPQNAVKYGLAKIRGVTASRCNLFTDEARGYAPFSKVCNAEGLSGALEYFAGIGCEQEFRELLVLDALSFNQDRHTGNYGVLFDNDTLEVLRMAPVFDLNLSMLPYVWMEEFEEIGDRLFDYGPKLGGDFTRLGQMGLNDALRDRVKAVKDFSFSFRGDDVFSEERVRKLEELVKRQAAAILSGDILYTKDVFFSGRAEAAAAAARKAETAAGLLERFMEGISSEEFGGEVFISTCVSAEAAQCIFELDLFEITVDFLEQKIILTDASCKELLPRDLCRTKKEFQALYEAVRHKVEAFGGQNGYPMSKASDKITGKEKK